MASLSELLRRWNQAANLRVRVLALWKLYHHPATPRAARWLAVAVLAYALSPIDLVPDFIPVLGQLDDLLLVPLGLWLVVRLCPPGLWQACLAEAQAAPLQRLPRWAWGIVVVGAIWLAACAVLLGAWWWHRPAT